MPLRLIFTAVVSAIVALIMACGGSSSSASKPLSGGSEAQTPLADGAIATVTAAAANVSNVQISAKDAKFSTDHLQARAGRLNFTFTNDDTAMPHSFALYKSKSDLKDPLGSTPIATGPSTQSFTLDLPGGDYYFQCQVHMDAMSGTLTVTP